MACAVDHNEVTIYTLLYIYLLPFSAEATASAQYGTFSIE